MSLKRSLDDYDKSQILASQTADALMSTLQSVKQYVIDTDRELVERFRSMTDTLIADFQNCLAEPNEKAFEDFRSKIRICLRDYRDRAGRYIDQLRTSLATTNATLQEVLSSVQAGDSNAETGLKNEISALTGIKQSKSVEEMRQGIDRSLAGLASCMEQFRQEKDVLVTQLRDEIRILQHTRDEARRAAMTDAATGVLNRQEFEKVMEHEVAKRTPIHIVRLTLQNLRQLSGWYPQGIIDQLLNAFAKRARGAMAEDATLGRWRENVFCALLHDDPKTIVSRLATKCRGNYICQDQGNPRVLFLDVVVSSTTVLPDNSEIDVVRLLDSDHSHESSI